MEITLDTTTVAAALGAVTGVLGTVGVAWSRVVRPIQRIAEDWHGEPARPDAGIAERPGMMLRMARSEELTRQIWNELHPNGGSSMKDQLGRVDANLGAHVASHSVMLYAPGPGQPPMFGSSDGTHGSQAAA